MEIWNKSTKRIDLREEISATHIVQGVSRLAFEFRPQGEGDRCMGILNCFDHFLPQVRTININCNYVGAQLFQKVEWTHGRGRTQQNECLIREVHPPRIADNLLDCLTTIGFDSPPTHPFVHLIEESVCKSARINIVF